MKNLPIGSLHGDLRLIADRICKTVADSMLMVWVSDRAEVFAGAGNIERDIALHCIVGTYSMGMQVNDVLDDLQEALRERDRIGLLD
ncbi:MAG: hypothetical protein ABIO49_05030 [Dokdonella sp.]